MKTNFIEPLQHVLSKELKEIHVSSLVNRLHTIIMSYMYV